MQQTTTYKLNKPESTDVFSVSPLNENADKLEAQLARLDGADAAETAARTAADAALDQRVTALEVHKVVAGSYKASHGQDLNFDLGFTPVAVIVNKMNFTDVHTTTMTVTGHPMYEYPGGPVALEIVEGGFRVGAASSQTNDASLKYCYIAFG